MFIKFENETSLSNTQTFKSESGQAAHDSLTNIKVLKYQRM